MASLATSPGVPAAHGSQGTAARDRRGTVCAYAPIQPPWRGQGRDGRVEQALHAPELPALRADQAIARIEKFVVVPKGGGRARRLRDWQRGLIRSAFDDPRPRLALCSIPRGNGKSGLASAVGLYGLHSDGSRGLPRIQLTRRNVNDDSGATRGVRMLVVPDPYSPDHRFVRAFALLDEWNRAAALSPEDARALRFVRDLADNGEEDLAIAELIDWLCGSGRVVPANLKTLLLELAEAFPAEETPRIAGRLP